MSALVSAIASLIASAAKHLPGFPAISGIAGWLSKVGGLVGVANALLPVGTTFQILGLMLGVWLVLIAWYWIAYLIAQIRGSSG